MTAAHEETSILDLPDEVKKNIVGYEDLELDEMLSRILKNFKGYINADRIIQLLWTQFERSPDRIKVITRLRKLSKAGLLEQQEGTRSMYRYPAPLLAAIAAKGKNNPEGSF